MIRHITLVRPNLGLGLSNDAMAPLVFAILRALTPTQIVTHVIDERVEPFVPVETDLVAMTVETFTALRAWDLADWYREHGVRVVVGGHHPSMCPDEALQHADAVVIGDAEPVWAQVIADAEMGALKSRYIGGMGIASDQELRFDRSVYGHRHYAPIELVQAGRGCRFACDFCSIYAFYGTRRAMRRPAEIGAEVAGLPRRRMIFFVDDNLFWKREIFLELMAVLAPLKRRWSCQITIDMARDDSLMDEMARAGCRLVIIGFESLAPGNLRQMRKNWNGVAGSYASVVERLTRRGIMVYGSFLFGYDDDRLDAFAQTATFANDCGLAIANFNPLTPMPGTGLYDRLEREGRLLRPAWWIDPEYRYGDAIFAPKNMSAKSLRDGPIVARSQFYALRSIATRTLRGLGPWGAASTGLMLTANLISRREIARKQGRRLSGSSAQPMPFLRASPNSEVSST